MLTTDILGPLERNEMGNKYILVVCDHFTKCAEAFPLKTMTAEEVASKLMLVICKHGVPDAILSDQGSNFQSYLIAELWELLDVHKLRTTPYHPECDGLSERFNRTLISMVSAFIDEKQDNWDKLLPMLTFAYNTAVHGTTKCTPFELIYGRKPKIPLDVICDEKKVNLQLTPEDYAENVSKVLEDIFKRVRQNTGVKMDKIEPRLDMIVM